MEEARPFFLLDWLDDLMVDQDAFQIAELLKTPSKPLPPRHRGLGAYHSRYGGGCHNSVSMTEFPLGGHRHGDDDDAAADAGAGAGAATNRSSNIGGSGGGNNIESTIVSPSMLRSISSPDVCATPRSSNCKRHPHHDYHDDHHHHHHHHPSMLLPTRLFHDSNGRHDDRNDDAGGGSGGSGGDHRNDDDDDVTKSQRIPEEEGEEDAAVTAAKDTATATILPHSRTTIADTAKPATGGVFKRRSTALGNGWNAKGLTKAKQGRWDAALACWDNALDIRLQISDPRCARDQLEVANTWNNRGIALGKLGRYQSAIRALQEAFRIRDALLGEGHQQVVSTLHNIANVHQQQGDLTTALRVFNKAKALLAESSSSSSTGTGSGSGTTTDPMLLARICTAIGHVYYQARQWVDSRDAYQDALNLLVRQPSPPSLSPSGEQQWRREVCELRRDIREVDGKISVHHHHHPHHHHRAEDAAPPAVFCHGQHHHHHRRPSDPHHRSPPAGR